MHLEAIIASLISGGLAFAGVLVTTFSGNKKIVNDIKLETTKSQAVTDTKIEELTREVREHNNFARRMPVVEEQIKDIYKDIEEIKKGR